MSLRNGACVIECLFFRHDARGAKKRSKNALRGIRPGGTLSSLGVYQRDGVLKVSLYPEAVCVGAKRQTMGVGAVDEQC